MVGQGPKREHGFRDFTTAKDLQGLRSKRGAALRKRVSSTKNKPGNVHSPRAYSKETYSLRPTSSLIGRYFLFINEKLFDTYICATECYYVLLACINACFVEFNQIRYCYQLLLIMYPYLLRVGTIFPTEFPDCGYKCNQGNFPQSSLEKGVHYGGDAE